MSRLGFCLAAIWPLAGLHAQSDYTSPYTFVTLAGDAGYGSANGIGNAARFNSPTGITLDASGNLYVADTQNLTIRKITLAGVVTTLAGSPGLAGIADGAGSAARFEYPVAVALDPAGNLYVADLWADSVRRITPAGDVTTLSTSFYRPRDLKLDGAGNLYVVSETGILNAPPGTSIIKVTPGGVATTVLFLPRYAALGSMALDRAGNIFVSVTNPGFGTYIEKVTPDAVVTLFAGSVTQTGGADGVGDAAGFTMAGSLTFDAAGVLYVADSGHIRKISPLAEVTTLATTAAISPAGLTLDASGNIYVTGNSAVVEISPAGAVTRIAGAAQTVPALAEVDGAGAAARFNLPAGIVVAPNGVIYVADYWGATIRKVTAAGGVTTLAGMPYVSGSTDGTGTAARFTNPNALALDASGNLYVSGGNAIRKVTPAGVVTTFAGTDGVSGSADGLGSAASFNTPTGVAIDASGNLFVADRRNHLIRKITPDGNVTTFAGGAGTPGTTDGTGGFARFNEPTGLAIDSAGNLFVADQVNHTIRKVTPARVVSTIAGSPGVQGNADGVGSAARFYSPSSVAIDGAGNLFVSEFNNHTIRKISPGGVVTTLGGFTGVRGADDGTGSMARFNNPTGIAVDANGTVYVADNLNCSVRVGLSAGSLAAPTITLQPVSLHVLVGGAASLSVAATGVPGPVYQWQQNGLNIAGANGTTYQIPSANLTDAGTYRVIVSNASGSVTSETVLLAVDDLSGPSGPTLIFENTATGRRELWLMGGANHQYLKLALDLGLLDPAWHIVGTADFNADGHPDILLENTVTGQRVLWLMGGVNNEIVTLGLDLGFLDPLWHIVGIADFSADGHPDILLENTATGQRVLWLMGGANSQYVTLGLDLGVLDPAWHIAGVADFNHDNRPDILLENTSSGQRVLWLMGGPNNQYVTLGLDLGVLDPSWRIAAVVDFNGDSTPDIVLENATSGQRVLWIMGGPNGAYVTLGLTLGLLDPAWHIVN